MGISCSRRVGPVSITMAIAGVTVPGVARAVGRGASLDATEIGLSAAIETPQSGSAVETRETRRSTWDIARRCARGAAGRKASGRCVRRTTKRWTAGAQTWRRTTGAETWRGTGEGGRRTRWRPKLRECSTWRDKCGAEHHGCGQHQKSLFRHGVCPSI